MKLTAKTDGLAKFFGTEESSLLGAKLSHEFRFLSRAVISVKREYFVKLAT